MLPTHNIPERYGVMVNFVQNIRVIAGSMLGYDRFRVFRLSRHVNSDIVS
jgi:hypothetical protein